MPGRNGSKGEIGEPGEPGTMVGTKTLMHCNSKLYDIKGNRGARGRRGEPGFNGTNGFDVRCSELLDTCMFKLHMHILRVVMVLKDKRERKAIWEQLASVECPE